MTSLLAIDIVGDADDAARAFDDVADAADRMARGVDDASRDADRAASRLDGIGESADNLDSKAAQATGSLGALSSGFELVGAEKYATGLQSAALATDFLAGVGEGLNLITQLSVVQKARDLAVTTAKAVAERAAAAATWAQVAATRALNIAMRANPIGLVITAVIALVGLFVVLYKRSTTFRNIVQAVMRAAGTAVRWVVSRVSELVRWVGQNAPAAWRKLQSIGVAVFRALTIGPRTLISWVTKLISWVAQKAPAAWQRLRSAAATVIRAIVTTVGNLINKVQDAIGWVRDRFAGAFNAVKSRALGPINAIRDAVGNVIDKIQSAVSWVGSLIDRIRNIPKLPDINPFNRAGAVVSGLGDVVGVGRAGATTTTQINVGGDTYHITADAMTDIDQLVRKLDRAAARRKARLYGVAVGRA